MLGSSASGNDRMRVRAPPPIRHSAGRRAVPVALTPEPPDGDTASRAYVLIRGGWRGTGSGARRGGARQCRCGPPRYTAGTVEHGAGVRRTAHGLGHGAMGTAYEWYTRGTVGPTASACATWPLWRISGDGRSGGAVASTRLRDLQRSDLILCGPLGCAVLGGRLPDPEGC